VHPRTFATAGFICDDICANRMKAEVCNVVLEALPTGTPREIPKVHASALGTSELGSDRIRRR